MKITCQSCQSKYNVADEKVQGKIVKIRCRKCGATIVVNGAAVGVAQAAAANGGAATSEGGEAPPASGVKAGASEGTIWHVNVAENDQRTMTVAELVHAHQSGTVTHDTYIWSEGMGDWMPLGEVDSVLSALGAGEGTGPAAPRADEDFAAEPPSLASAAEPGPAALADPEEQTRAFQSPGRMPRDPAATEMFASARTAAEAAKPEPKRAAVKRETRGRDLFAGGLGASESPSSESLNDGPRYSAPGAPLVDDSTNKLTGERNENSVLFSLAVLTKTAEDRAPAARQADGHGGDSGLIDLKALAAKTESMRPNTAADNAVFSAPLGALPTLAAPLGAIGTTPHDHPSKSRVPVLIGLGAGALLILVLGIVIGVKALGGAPATGPAGSSSAEVASASGEPVATAPAASASSEGPAPAASASAPLAVVKPKPPTGGSTWHPQAPTPPKAGAGVAAAPPPSPPPPPAAPAPAVKKNDCGCNGDLMCLMKCSTH